MRNAWVFALATGALAISPSALSGTRHEASIGAWDITSYVSDAGYFSHCMAFATYRSGIGMGLTISASFQWKLGFINPSWRLKKGEVHPVDYWVDNGRRMRGQASVASAELVFIDLPDSGPLFDEFRRGHVLFVRAGGEQLQFSLRGSNAALTAAGDCASRNVAARSSNPFASGPPRSSEPQDDVALRAEAATFTANLLSSAGIPGFQMVDASSDALKGYHSMFVAPGLVGGLMILKDATVEMASAAVMSVAASNCAGRLATATLPTEDRTGSHVQTVCETSEGTTETSYFMIPRPKGGVYGFELAPVLVPVGGLPQPEKPAEPISDISGKLMDAGLNLTR